TLHRTYPKTAVTLLVAIAVISVFTLHSFAALDVSKLAEQPGSAQNCTGTLTVKGGQGTINGNPAQTGAPVMTRKGNGNGTNTVTPGMTGSVIATGSNAGAIVDLGSVGLVELGENTTVTLTCASGSLEIRMSCDKNVVEVRRGSLDVKAPKVETVTSGKKK